MNWENLVSVLLDVRWPEMQHLAARWEGAALTVLLVALAFLVLWEDWRIALVAWSTVGVTMALLLARVLPVPWALSRMLAAGIDGALFWLGARRWPRARVRPGAGIWLRLPLLGLALLTAWQARPYLYAVWSDAARADAFLALALGGLLLMALQGDALHGTIGLLLWLNAAVLALASFPIPTDWFLPITLLDVIVAAVGSIGLASVGEGAFLWTKRKGT